MFLSVVIFGIAATINRGHLQARLFCYLHICVLVAFLSVSSYSSTWLDLYSAGATDIQYENVVFAFYMAGAALNFMLLYFLWKFDTGYKYIAIPIAYCTILNLLVPLESLIFGTQRAFSLYNATPELINILEITLLVVDRAQHRRNGKQWLSSAYSSLYPIPINSIFNRTR